MTLCLVLSGGRQRQISQVVARHTFPEERYLFFFQQQAANEEYTPLPPTSSRCRTQPITTVDSAQPMPLSNKSSLLYHSNINFSGLISENHKSALLGDNFRKSPLVSSPYFLEIPLHDDSAASPTGSKPAASPMS